MIELLIDGDVYVIQEPIVIEKFSGRIAFALICDWDYETGTFVVEWWENDANI